MVIPKAGEIEVRRTDVVVIGAGAAGLRAAIALSDIGAEVLVLGKRPRTDAHTVLAAGGINAALGAMDPGDTWYIHAADTLFEGRMLGDPEAVEILCREAPRAIEELVRYGAGFARSEDGRLLQRFFGAHRYRRTCFAGDHTGRTIMEALLAEVNRRAIAVEDGVYVTDLFVDSGRVTGALAIRLDGTGAVCYQAGATLLATGGHTFVYGRTSSRVRENTGDGMALALRAGARLADMEMVQFHPTGMIWPPEAAGTLVTEAVRGEGGRLYNARGERFMTRHDPERMELSTRDRVALANYLEILEGRGTEHGGVSLDISHMPATLILERLPRMVEQFRTYGEIDITRQPMEVAPTAHYSMGGVHVQASSHSTGVPGLFAAGEVASGVHGANRLGGNSLTECVVFGRRAGVAAAEYARAHELAPPARDQIAEMLARVEVAARIDEAGSLRFIEGLRNLMWRRAGLVRDAEGLATARAEIGRLREQRGRLPEGEPRPENLAAAMDLDSMLVSAEATVRAALFRTESRGAHQRSDYPNTEDSWRHRVVVWQGRHGLELATEDVPPPSPEVAAALSGMDEIAVTGRLLE